MRFRSNFDPLEDVEWLFPPPRIDDANAELWDPWMAAKRRLNFRQGLVAALRRAAKFPLAGP
jgi:hypothetical protein